MCLREDGYRMHVGWRGSAAWGSFGCVLQVGMSWECSLEPLKILRKMIALNYSAYKQYVE